LESSSKQQKSLFLESSISDLFLKTDGR
jgi:hypothetical protein